MNRRLVLGALLLLLTAGLWLSGELQAIAGGVALFLFGMLSLEEGFTAFTGGRLGRFLEKTTRTTPRSLTFGLVSTSLMQSSSLVSVIAISFLSAGLIGLAQGIGIIFGANLGTTTGAWLMAGFGMKVKISAYAMPMLVFGVVFVLSKSRVVKGVGRILAGFGFLFLGIHYMKEGFESFQSAFDLAQFTVSGLAGLMLFCAVGIAATVVMQSSHATLMLTIAALASQQISYENALALAIGANVGTTITAILGCISANIEGKRLALAHLVFNVITASIAIAAIEPFRRAVDEVAMATGIGSDDWTLKLAVFHTLFNLVGVLLMTPLIPLLVRVLERRVKGPKPDVAEPRHLNESALLVPEVALEVLRKETALLFDTAFELLAHGLNIHRKAILSDEPLDEVVRAPMDVLNLDVVRDYYGRVKSAYSEIVSFAARAEKGMSREQADALYDLRIACRNIAKSIKGITLMMENINASSRSKNADVRKEYDDLRWRLASILREIFRLRLSREDDLIFVHLNRIRKLVEESDVLATGRIDHLIRHERVTKTEATSLMNDASMASDVGRWLVETAERLFVPRGSDLKALQAELLGDTGMTQSYDEVLHTGRLRALPLAPPSTTLTGEYRRLTERGDGDQEAPT